MGMARIAGSLEDGQARDWFVNEARALGCDVQIDEIGNIFAVLKRPELQCGTNRYGQSS